MKLNIFGFMFMIALTLGSGVMQGLLSNRWGISDFQRQAGAKLDSVPKSFGNWEMKKSEKLDQDAIDQLEPYGYFVRQYVNRASGATVYVTLLLGPSGPISVHTPEVCYAGRDHQQLGNRNKVELTGKAGKDSFWKTSFQLRGVDAPVQNIYYAWSPGDQWVASENPRLSFATRPYLYKIQISGVAQATNAGASDSATDTELVFLADFIPVLNEYLQKPSSK
jgi:hypothetical protein